VEIGIVLAGRYEVHYTNHSMAYTPGSVWLCAPWEPHGVRISAPDTQYILLQFHPNFIGEEMIGPFPWLSLFSPPPQERILVSDGKLRHSAMVAGQIMWQEINAKSAYWEDTVRYELLRLLVDLARNWAAASAPTTTMSVTSATSLARIMPALTLVHNALGHHVNVAEAAKVCNLSRSGFQNTFQQTMGMAFGEFQRRARLSLVANLLANTDRTIGSIAAEAGFVDDSHLRRQFTAEFQCTPGEYRKRFQSRPSETQAP
jgi:AraC-like DNA-binding protein